MALSPLDNESRAGQTPMDHEAAFLEAIAQEPDNDALRLIFADYLDERDDPRGEFIRVQIELAGMAHEDPLAPSLRRREFELWKANQDRWVGNCKSWLVDWDCERGLLHSITISAATLIEHADELFRLGPIRELHLGPALTPVMSALLALPQLARIRSLDFHSLATEDVRQLADWPHLATLTSLILRGNDLGTEAVRALTHGDLSQLRRLDLSENIVDASGAELLAQCPRLVLLTDLNLDFNKLSNAGAEALASSRHLAALGILRLSANGLQPPAIRALAISPHLRQLTRLELQGNGVMNAGLEHLATSPNLRGLTGLGLAQCHIGRGGALSLAKSRTLTQLQELDLSRNRIEAFGADALAKSEIMSGLRRLSLGGNEIGDEGAKSLAASPHFQQVRHLELSGNGLSAFGVKALTRSKSLQNLRHLGLQGNKLGDMGLQVLARWPGLECLTSLSVRDNHIGDLGVTDFLASPYRGSLGLLDLSSNQFSQQTTAALAKYAQQAKMQLILDPTPAAKAAER
jgi:uncharacterized protein (TIGR02996 family)